jgi:hypothetical protein
MKCVHMIIKLAIKVRVSNTLARINFGRFFPR